MGRQICTLVIAKSDHHRGVRNTKGWLPGEAQPEEQYEPSPNFVSDPQHPTSLPHPIPPFHPAVAALFSRRRMAFLMVSAKALSAGLGSPNTALVAFRALP